MIEDDYLWDDEARRKPPPPHTTFMVDPTTFTVKDTPSVLCID
ncbi:hypothetical protein RDI58_019819 [Solanum bulbocastanum]|uniref:Uncharacterized protein n=1 Tax=Solanum bulbocastanum TaxID=147425 RepID=A0AAN8YA20_SOLBU